MTNLLLITFEGQLYGIREEEVRAVEDLPSLHRLPLSPACIAGMAIREGRTVTLADLSVCVGRGSLDQTKRKRLLFVPTEGAVQGFAVSEEIKETAVPPAAVFPLPSCLGTEVIDHCALIDSLPVPLINLARLHDHLRRNASEPPAASCIVPPASVAQPASAESRVFVAGGELFAVPSELCDNDTARSPGPIATIRPVPKFVCGVTWHHDRLIPVFDPVERMQLTRGEGNNLMLVVTVQGMRLGIMIEEDRGIVSGGQTVRHQVPPIAALSWLQSALVLDGCVIPALDVSELFSARSGRGPAPDPSGIYTADSSFPVRFGKEDIEVTEFSLLGMRHAVPRSEQEAVIGFKTFRPVPGTLAIVAGVAEYEEELLPVIDLATVFGRRSLATPEWSMIVVKNGNFRALVLAENVFGDRRLGRDLQRAVPIALPYDVVYGCYLGTDAVRLILNVRSMAVHFESTLVQEMLPVLSRTMGQPLTELAGERTGELRKSVLTAGTVAEEVKADTTTSASVPSRDISAESPVSLAGAEPVSTPAVEELSKPASFAAAVPEAGSSVQEAHADSAEEKGPSLPQEAVIEGSAGAAIAVGPQDVQTPEHPDIFLRERGTLPLQEPAAESSGGASIAETPREGHDISGSDVSGTSPAAETGVGAVQAREGGEDAAQVIMKDSVASGEGVAPSEQPPAPEPEPLPKYHEVAARTEIFTTPHSHAEPSVPGAVPSVPEPERPVQPVSTSFEPSSPREDERWRPVPPVKSKKRVRWLYYAAVVLVLLAVIGVFKRTDRQQVVPKPPATTPSVATTPTGSGEKETLVLEVPGDRAIESEVYIVRPGDTLWHISGRFTGNPRNYPHIAGENQIADPDLIFPDQKIRLKRQDMNLKSKAEAADQHK